MASGRPPEGRPQDLSEMQLSGALRRLEVWICRCDAQLGTEVPGGTFVTVESGPHHGLLEGYRQLCRAPVKRQGAPDITFLPLDTPVWALQEVVRAKPRILISAEALTEARDPSPTSGRSSKLGFRTQMTRMALSPPSPACSQPGSCLCRRQGAQSPPLDGGQRHPTLGLGSRGVTKPRRGGGSRQARADATGRGERAGSPAAGAAAMPAARRPALSTEHSVAGSKPPWQGAAMEQLLQPSVKFYVVSVLPRLLPTVADSERCALAQAGPFNSHTLAEQALNQPGRERLGQLVKLPLNAEVFPRVGDLSTLIIKVPVEGPGPQRAEPHPTGLPLDTLLRQGAAAFQAGCSPLTAALALHGRQQQRLQYREQTLAGLQRSMAAVPRAATPLADTEARSSVAARPTRVGSGNLAMEHLLAVAEQETQRTDLLDGSPGRQLYPRLVAAASGPRLCRMLPPLIWGFRLHKSDRGQPQPVAAGAPRVAGQGQLGRSAEHLPSQAALPASLAQPLSKPDGASRSAAGLQQPEVPASRMSPAHEARRDGPEQACSRQGPGKASATSTTLSADDQSAGSTDAAPRTSQADASHAMLHVPRRKRTGGMRRAAGATNSGSPAAKRARDELPGPVAPSPDMATPGQEELLQQSRKRLRGASYSGTQQPDAPDAWQPAVQEPPTSTAQCTSNSRGSQQLRLRTEALHKKESRDSDQTEAACPGHLPRPGTATPLTQPSSQGAPAPTAADAPLLHVSARERAAAVASMLQKLLGAAPSAEPAELLAMLQSLLEPC